jgi:dihydrofolate reductase
MSVPVVLVAAVARNGVIGAGNALPWRLSTDLKRFKALTIGRPVIMGRKTFDSIGKPLPDRETIVITRDPARCHAQVHVAAGVEGAVELARMLAIRMGADSIPIIGGGQIYAQSMDFADRLEITEVEAAPEGDALFPPVDQAVWRETAREAHPAGPRDDHAFSFVTLTRK